jgi:hypothetical protein
MNKLPIFRATIENEECGMFTISLVDYPATESDFLAFKDEKELVRFKVENEDKHIVRGLVMAANMLIYRFSPTFGEYYITYEPETIRLMAEKYLFDGNQNNVDLMHDGNLVDGVNMVQLFIKDAENGINPKGFEDYADGSLFAEFQVHNEEVWSQIKEGNFKGFSLEGYFGVEPVEFKQVNNETNKDKMKINRIKEMLKKMLVSLGEVSTDKAVIIFDGDELEAGMEVHTLDEEGNEVNLEDGDYKTEDGKVIVIADNKVVEIKDDEAEVATEEPTEEPVEEENAENEPVSEDEPENEETPDEDEKDAEIKRLMAQIEELEAENEELKAKVAELEKEPAAPSAEEEFAAMENDNTKANKLRNRGYKF